MRKIIFTIGFILLLGATTCLAQDQRQRRRQLFEDLLKNLVESQLEKAQPQPEHDHPADLAPRQPNVQPSSKVINARQHFVGMGNSAGNLINELRQLEVNSPKYRPMLADAMKVKAQIDSLNQLSARYPNLEPLDSRFRQLDQDWRMLNYELGQVSGLPAQCKRTCNTINDYQTKLCGIFEVQPQVNRRELMRLSTAMNTNFEHLLQDIYYDLRAEPQMPGILKQGRGLYAQISQASSMINRGTYEELVNAYKGCTMNWRKFNAQISEFPSERIRRDVQNIEELGRQISAQLWVPMDMDRDYLARMCSNIYKDCDQILDNISVAQLLACESPGIVISSARDFRSICNSFNKNIMAGKSHDELHWEFKNLNTKWGEMQTALGQFKSGKVTRRIEEIENSMDVLSQTFGSGPAISRVTVLNMLEELDQLSQDLSHEIHHLVKPPRYQGNFHIQICSQGDALHDAVHDFRAEMVTNRRMNARAGFDQIIQIWTAMRPMINRCQADDRREFAPLRNQIDALMVKLQVVFAS